MIKVWSLMVGKMMITKVLILMVTTISNNWHHRDNYVWQWRNNNNNLEKNSG